MAMTLDGSNGVTFNDASLQGAAASPYVLKNRIINGDMRIDQRNAGASVSANNSFPVDRWLIYGTQVSKFTAQQNAGSVTPPSGYTNYLGSTSSSAYSVLSGDFFSIQHRIEGYNIADLGWGTATAKTVTLSFWVRSSLTGTFGGAFYNADGSRSYPFSYTISAANTWEQKTITIAGDTTGTWLTTNGIGIIINFSLGAGSTYSGTANAWSGTSYVQPTGSTSVVGTNGATFYITGVQLEQNTVATPFERRLYNQELANCQRYCPVVYIDSGNQNFVTGMAFTTTSGFFPFTFTIPARVAPTGITYTGTVANLLVYEGATSRAVSALTGNSYWVNGATLAATHTAGAAAGTAVMLSGESTAQRIIFNGCEL